MTPPHRLTISQAFYKNVFVGYELKMRDGTREWSVMKRYSSIRSFVQALKKHNGYTIAATFPPKVIGKVNIDDRRLGLEWYLRALLREPSLRNQVCVGNARCARTHAHTRTHSRHASTPSHLICSGAGPALPHRD